jgi:outer membrane lipoprotein-sorting protein
MRTPTLVMAWTIASMLALRTTSAQTAQPTPATVLQNVLQFYADVSYMKAFFRHVITISKSNTIKTSDGRLWVARPMAFRFDYVTKQQNTARTTKSFVSDGVSLWLVDNDNKQIFQDKIQDSVLPAAVLFLTDSNALTTAFDIELSTSGKYGNGSGTVLELTPKLASSQYKQLIFVVDSADWHVLESIVIATNGDVDDFTFFRPNLTTAPSSELFKPTGVELRLDPRYPNAGCVPQAQSRRVAT